MRGPAKLAGGCVCVRACCVRVRCVCVCGERREQGQVRWALLESGKDLGLNFLLTLGCKRL